MRGPQIVQIIGMVEDSSQEAHGEAFTGVGEHRDLVVLARDVLF